MLKIEFFSVFGHQVFFTILVFCGEKFLLYLEKFYLGSCFGDSHNERIPKNEISDQIHERCHPFSPKTEVSVF